MLHSRPLASAEALSSSSRKEKKTKSISSKLPKFTTRSVIYYYIGLVKFKRKMTCMKRKRASGRRKMKKKRNCVISMLYTHEQTHAHLRRHAHAYIWYLPFILLNITIVQAVTNYLRAPIFSHVDRQTAGSDERSTCMYFLLLLDPTRFPDDNALIIFANKYENFNSTCRTY